MLLTSRFLRPTSSRFAARSPLVILLVAIFAAVLPPPAHANEKAHNAVAHQLSIEAPAGNDEIRLEGQDDRWQLLVTQSTTQHGTRIHSDVTREVRFSIVPESLGSIDELGHLTPLANGRGQISAVDALGNEATIALSVHQMDTITDVNFPNQIVPIFTKFGCNGGGCHGKSAGQAGFKLSLLGFEAKEDYEHLVYESRGRRVFPAAPDHSLLLRKAVNKSPHGGGQRMQVNSPEYRLLRRWIETGMPYGSDHDPVVTSIEITPKQRVLLRESSQQLSVIAHYNDGSIEDISHTAQYESNNTDLADVSDHGLVQLRDQAGDVSIMARYQGHVAVFQASIPLGQNIDGFPWPQERNLVDRFVFKKLRALGIPPSSIADDETWIRRVTLDIAGRLPTPKETTEFLTLKDESKFSAKVRELLASPGYADHFAKKWSAILRNTRPTPGHQFSSFAFHNWLRTSLQTNKPYDQFVTEILTASGDVDSNAPVAWYQSVTNMESRVEDAAQLFLGQRLQCARCHHHPYEKWSQRDYFQMAAFFSKVKKKEGQIAEQPVFVSRIGGAGARHPKTGENLPPAPLGQSPLALQPEDDPRVALADWMTARDNPYFAKSLVNRYWKHFFSKGIVEPEDDLRITNPPSNAELLDGLAEFFVEKGFDLQELIHLLCTSSTYRLSSSLNDLNESDSNTFSRFYPRRLSAEVLLDAVDQVGLTTTEFAGLPAHTKAISLPDTSYSSYFLDVFGQPDGATACECERSGEVTLAQSLHLLNSKEVQAKLSNNAGLAASMAASSDDMHLLVEQLYQVALSRKPSDAEMSAAIEYLVDVLPDQRRSAFEDLVWAIINTKEFLFNH
ncbi:MAG: DUF1549 domain-containing protein [Aureliella sp.]